MKILSNVYWAQADTDVDLDNEEMDVTLFRGAANNSYFAVYFNALPEAGAEDVGMEIRAVDLRPERDVTLHVEIYNPNGTVPLIIYDRRNLGRSQVTFGSEPQMVEEGEDLHVLIDRLRSHLEAHLMGSVRISASDTPHKLKARNNTQ